MINIIHLNATRHVDGKSWHIGEREKERERESKRERERKGERQTDRERDRPGGERKREEIFE